MGLTVDNLCNGFLYDKSQDQNPLICTRVYTLEPKLKKKSLKTFKKNIFRILKIFIKRQVLFHFCRVEGIY